MTRRAVSLPEQDSQFLSASGSEWETVKESGARWILVHDLKVPPGYTVPAVTLALMIPPGYPDAPMDMAWVFPALERADGAPIPNTETRQEIDGRAFQRWSRHRAPGQAWRPGVDDIGTHMAMACDWFAAEFRKRPVR